MKPHSTASDTMDHDILTENIATQIMCHLGVNLQQPGNFQPTTAWQFPWINVERNAYKEGRGHLIDTIVGAIRLHDQLIEKVFKENSKLVFNERRPFSPEESASIVTSLDGLKTLVDLNCPNSLKENPYYDMKQVRQNIRSIINHHHDQIAPYLTGGKYEGHIVARRELESFSDSKKMSVNLVMAVIWRGGRQGWVNEINEDNREREASRERKALRGREGR
jgi:hypothetical protein